MSTTAGTITLDDLNDVCTGEPALRERFVGRTVSGDHSGTGYQPVLNFRRGEEEWETIEHDLGIAEMDSTLSIVSSTLMGIEKGEQDCEWVAEGDCRITLTVEDLVAIAAVLDSDEGLPDSFQPAPLTAPQAA